MPKRGSRKTGAQASKKKRASSDASDVHRAPIPFDSFLRSLNPSVPFHNNNGDCADPETPEHNREQLLVQLAVYANQIGLGNMLDPESIYLNSRFDRYFGTFITRWQAHSTQSINIYELIKTHLPPLSRPIVLYRGYKTGIDGDQPEVGRTWDMGLRSCSLSQGFAESFFTSPHPTSFVARIDVLPGVHVLPMLPYGQDGLLSEFEVLVNGRLRVHVLDPALLLEGRTEMPPPPMDYKCPEKFFIYSHTEPLKRVRFFFVLSLPGTEVQYYPNFEDRETNLRVGGGKAVYLNDQNQLGTGNPETILRSYLAPKKRKSLKRSVRSKRFSIHAMIEPPVHAAAAGGSRFLKS